MKRPAAAVFIICLLSGCSSYSYGTVSGNQLASVAATAKTPASIAVSEFGPTRPHSVLGDIDVTVNKTTVFNKDPTRADVDDALREKAAAIGADAVVLVRYGTVGISAISWGSLSGKGRAIVYTR